MSKIKVLTVQFDVTHLPDHAVEELKTALEVQGEEIVVMTPGLEAPYAKDEVYYADLFNSAVREVDIEEDA